MEVKSKRQNHQPRAVWALPGVRETHTYVVMEEVKETGELPLRA